MEANVPTYQYACTACGHRLEAVQSFSDEPLTECPACEGRLRKLFSAVGIVFKGSGFYRTDSRNGSSGKSGTSTKEPVGSSSANGSSGSSSANGSSGSGSSGSGSSGSGSASGSSSSSTAPATAGAAAS
jgi:putative FmdB family regulatory protein